MGTYSMGGFCVQGAFLHLLLLCGFAGFHCVRCGGLAGFLGELGDGVAGGVLGGVVALHLLFVLGGGVDGGVRVVVLTVARAHGVLGSEGSSGGPARGQVGCLGGGGRLV